MRSLCFLFTKYIFVVTFFIIGVKTDKPCAARPGHEGESIICVCNVTYCDEIEREIPENGQYFAYTSSKAGKRFEKTKGYLKSMKGSKPDSKHKVTLIIEPDVVYQTIEGFGSAVTDSAGMNWKSLSPTLRTMMAKSYFGVKGLEYNLIRVPIGGSDFSSRAYAFNEWPEHDAKLTNYTLAYEDYEYKIPMIKEILRVAKTPVHIIGTTWSPPPWMKSNNKWYGYSTLKKQYFETYADYHYKFLERYEEEKIKIWGITTTNEPLNGIIPLVPYAKNLTCLGWLQNDMGTWIVNHLGPKIRNSKYRDLKILAMDDQRYSITSWFDTMIDANRKVLDFIDGLAVHYYGNEYTPVSLLVEFREKYPDLPILNTEACEGAAPEEILKVLLGSWKRAEGYIHNIITDLNYFLVGWMDWNICLDIRGGPTFINNFVDSPVIVFPENDEFIKQPMFYAMGHFSKFIPRGSKRIQVTSRKPVSFTNITNVAFTTPDSTTVVVLYNEGACKTVCLKVGNKVIPINMDSSSITTVEFKDELEDDEDL